MRSRGSRRAKGAATRDRLKKRLSELSAQAENLLKGFRNAANGGGSLLAQGLGDIEQEMDRIRLRLGETESRIHAVDSACKQSRVVAEMLETFDGIWDVLLVEERRELLHLLIERITVDIDAGDLRVASATSPPKSTTPMTPRQRARRSAPSWRAPPRDRDRRQDRPGSAAPNPPAGRRRAPLPGPCRPTARARPRPAAPRRRRRVPRPRKPRPSPGLYPALPGRASRS